MKSRSNGHTDPDDIGKIKTLYQNLLESWNNNNPEEFSQLFTTDGNSIGFDGSQMNGQKQIRDELDKIFQNHKVSSYVGIIREIRTLSSTVFVLRAIAGMIPPGRDVIKPDVNAIQTLIAKRQGDEFRITLFQNTPAAFHGRPEAVSEMTNELQKAYDDGVKNHKG